MTRQPERPLPPYDVTGNHVTGSPAISLTDLRNQYCCLPKDFVETVDGLLAAVVAHGTENVHEQAQPVADQPSRESRVLVYPRYQRLDDGSLRKLQATEAAELIVSSFPHYHWRSAHRDVHLTAVPLTSIASFYHPEQALQRLVAQLPPLAAILGSYLPAAGITGSRLIGAGRPDSDLDLVIYGLQNFDAVRQLLVQAVRGGLLAELTEADWRHVYERRGELPLSFDDYLWHEKRKQNKFILHLPSTGNPATDRQTTNMLATGLQPTTLDVSCVSVPHPMTLAAGRKLGQRTITARVLSDQHAFNTPALFELDHPHVRWLVVNTATYVGQAFAGETIAARGFVESLHDGSMRLVIGASREAPGEFVRVIPAGSDHKRNINY